MLLNVMRLGAVLVVLGFSVPHPFVADFEAGNATAKICDESSHSIQCATGGVGECTLNKIICGGGEENDSYLCLNGEGNRACAGDEDCAENEKHAKRYTDCVKKKGNNSPVVPAPPGG